MSKMTALNSFRNENRPFSKAGEQWWVGHQYSRSVLLPNRSSTWVYILRPLHFAPHEKPSPKSALYLIFIKMCRLHTEVLFLPCGHTCFDRASKKSCDCKKDFLSMTVSKNRCLSCLQALKSPEEATPQNPITKTEIADIEDWLRRLKDLCKVETAIYGPLPVELLPARLEADEPRTAALLKMLVRVRPVQLDYKPNHFLTDRCVFIFPVIKVVPRQMTQKKPVLDREPEGFHVGTYSKGNVL